MSYFYRLVKISGIIFSIVLIYSGDSGVLYAQGYTGKSEFRAILYADMNIGIDREFDIDEISFTSDKETSKRAFVWYKEDKDLGYKNIALINIGNNGSINYMFILSKVLLRSENKSKREVIRIKGFAVAESCRTKLIPVKRV